MRTKNLLVVTSFIIVGVAVQIFAQPVFAGGGSIQSVNFSEGQQITGKSFGPVIGLKDPATDWSQPWVGQEFSMRAHGDLAGASCDTTQRVTDSQGQIKGNCKADTYGTFVFDVVAANGNNNGTFTVHFIEQGQGSGSGFNEQTPAGDYTVHITNGNFSVTPNQVFSLTAQVKQNGQVLSNYDSLQYIRWEVLQGSMSFVGNSDPLTLNPQLRILDLGKTVIRATAIMKDGRTFQSGSITVTVAWPAPKATATTNPTTTTNGSSNSGSSSNTDVSPTSTPSPSSKPTPRPTASSKIKVTALTASPAAELTATPSASEAPQVEPVVQEPEKKEFILVVTIRNIGNKIADFFSHLWKR